MRLQIAGLLWEDNSYGNIPLDFSQAIVCLRISGTEVYMIHRCLGIEGWYGVQGLRGLVKPTTMVMVCSTGLNPICPNWGENALVTKCSRTLEH